MDNEFKVGDKIQTKLGKRIGIVEKIFSDNDNPIQVNFGYGDCYTFHPSLLEKIEPDAKSEGK